MEEFNKSKVAMTFAFLMIPAMIFAAEYTLDECQQKAAEGVAEAQWQLGLRYENGDGVKKNNMKAVSQYKKAAEQKHRKACGRLADLYEKGSFVKKDPVLAAKYRAWSQGDNGELAAAQARTSVEKSKEDEIETALDYILGRNGKAKDPKTGIRVLYQSAKDKPIAQRVFVDRWSKGDLDGALEVLSDDEWEKILPWYQNAWNSGNKRAGLVLGNDAYLRKQYSSALGYWQGSGLAKCWYFVGRFYATWSEEGKGGGPSSMKDETKARKAYEKCLRIDSSWDDAKFDLGCLYLFAKNKENKNLSEAKKIFAYFLKKAPNDKWYNYDYGLAGYWHQRSQFDKKWPKRRVDTLLAWAKQYEQYQSSYSRVPEYERRNIADYNRMIEDWKSFERSREEYVSYIQKAANLGCEPAQKFMSDYNSNK